MAGGGTGPYIRAMAVVSLSFAFEDNGTQHNDLVLRLDEFERRCDSFYLALDNYLLPEDEDAEKVRAVLVRLLEQWRLLVTGLGPGEVTYLPYEFDDQCSGWIQVTAVRNDDVELLPVWSNLEGWAFYPSSFTEELGRIGATTPVWKSLPAQHMTRGDLLNEIEKSIEAVHRKAK